MKVTWLHLGLIVGIMTPVVGIAVDGGLEINQACVEAGCFDGDDPGFPVEIRNPGIYFLTSNIEIGDATKDTIRIDRSNVELDLNGFSVTGPNECDDLGNCTVTELAGVGIGSNQTNIEVKNGFVGGFGFAGIQLGHASRIVNVQASNNFRKGFGLTEGGTIKDCVATNNGNIGIEVKQARITDSTAIGNGQFGIAIGQNSIVEGVVSRENDLGITDFDGSSIFNSTIAENRGAGIEAIRGSTTITGSRLVGNGSVAVSARGDSSLTDGGAPVIVRDSVFFGNSGSFDGPNFGGAGPIIGAGTNLCGADTVCDF